MILDLGSEFSAIDCSSLIWDYMCQARIDGKERCIKTIQVMHFSDNKYGHPSLYDFDLEPLKAYVRATAASNLGLS